MSEVNPLVPDRLFTLDIAYSEHQKGTTKMATSMAAAIAASLPAPTAQAAPAPAPIEIPESMQKVIDIEAEIPLENVQLDGMVPSTDHSQGCTT